MPSRSRYRTLLTQLKSNANDLQTNQRTAGAAHILAVAEAAPTREQDAPLPATPLPFLPARIDKSVLTVSEPSHA
jgi:hypothetical protein